MTDALDLKRHGACRALTETLVQAWPASFRAAVPARVVEAGAKLYARGGPTDVLFAIESGTVRTSITSPAGDDVLIASYGAGELVGELCFCEVRARQEDAVAVGRTRVIALGVPDLLDAVGRSPEAALAVLEALCHRVDAARRRLGEVGFEDGEHRVMLRVLDLAESEGVVVSPGVVAVARRPTQAAVAASAFVSREFANALLGRLREEGVIDFDRSGPMTVAVDRLRARLGRG